MPSMCVLIVIALHSYADELTRCTQASLLWYMGLSQTDIKRLASVEYMSIFNIRTTTLQSRLRFLRDQVRGPASLVRLVFMIPLFLRLFSNQDLPHS